jgi:hypothetical protein
MMARVLFFCGASVPMLPDQSFPWEDEVHDEVPMVRRCSAGCVLADGLPYPFAIRFACDQFARSAREYISRRVSPVGTGSLGFGPRCGDQ